MRAHHTAIIDRPVQVHAGRALLDGNLTVPEQAGGLVIFAHGSGSGRHSPRNYFVADRLNQLGLGTLLMDLLTREEEAIDLQTAEMRFDIPMLSERLAGAAQWAGEEEFADLPIGFFGASTGAAAALVAAAKAPARIHAVVSRGGRPDLAGPSLPRVKAPTLLIVGGADAPVIALNRAAMERMQCERQLEIVPHAGHLFETPGALEEVARLAGGWFTQHLRP